MSPIKLIQPTKAYTTQLLAYKKSFGEMPAGIAGTAELYFAKTIDAWLLQLKKDVNIATVASHRVPALQFIAVTTDTNEIVGMLNFRLSLNDYLENFGGHIGYSIAPQNRRQGYGTEMLRLALRLAPQPPLRLSRVLVTCNDTNLGSAKVIENNCGVLEDQRFDEDDQQFVRRYWIETA